MMYKVSLSQLSKDNNKQVTTTSIYSLSEDKFEKVRTFIESLISIPDVTEIAKSIEEENASLSGRFVYPNKEKPSEVQETMRKETLSSFRARGKRYIYDDKTIKALIHDGKTDGEISRLLEIPYQTIHGYIKKKGYRSSDTLFI